MSTYAVFGMTRAAALAKARKAVKTNKKVGGKWIAIAEKEWLALVDDAADKIMSGDLVIQLSDKFDAPQYAAEYMRLAKSIESRSLCVRAYHKVDAENQKPGKPKMKWSPVSLDSILA